MKRPEQQPNKHFKKLKYEKKVPSIDENTKSLPVFQYQQVIIDAVNKHSTTIVVGETGSGKSTQIPQFLVDSDIISMGKAVVCTQPRRVAAITIAEKVAQERGTLVGQGVGYSIRFEDKSTPNTLIKYVTDGVLLREAMSDALLSRYSVIVLDEAHERSMQTDILMGLLKLLQRKRKDLKIVVMSATLQVELFSEYFQDSNVVYVPGRQYPVSILYTKEPQSDYIDAALLTYAEDEDGGVLVFLPGQEDIEAMQQLLIEHLPTVHRTTKATARQATANKQATAAVKAPTEPKAEPTANGQEGGVVDIQDSIKQDFVIFPLYAAMPAEEQLKAFQSIANQRKFVLATNIAETSVTIRGISYVVDTGYVKTRTILEITGIEMLKTIAVSKSQANQRAGRAGREGPGACYRLYPEAVYETNLAETTTPEISRMNIAQVLLQLKLMEPMLADLTSAIPAASSDPPAVKQEDQKQGKNEKKQSEGVTATSSSSSSSYNILSFPFLTRPSNSLFKQALTLLLSLQALNHHQQLTALGEQMARLPLHPAYAKMLLSSHRYGCTQEVLSAVALLSTENVYLSTAANQKQQQS